MKIVSLSLYRQISTQESPLLAQKKDLSFISFMYRGTVDEQLKFHTRTIVERTQRGSRQTVDFEEELDYVCHVYVRADGLCGTVVSDKEYPQNVAHRLINRMLTDFDDHDKGKWKNVAKDIAEEPEFLSTHFEMFQDPRKGDKLTNIQQNLDEIKDIMHKNIDEVLQRGEKLDDLMAKSEDLSATSVTFYKNAKKTNACCKSY